MFERWPAISRPLYFLFAGTTITRMGTFVFPYLTIYLTESRDYGFETVGLILSVGSLGLLAGNFAGGVLTDCWSRKGTLILALLLNATGFAGLSLNYEFAGLYALFLFIGYLGTGMYTPAANTLIAELTAPDIRSFAYTINYTCINVGMGLGPLLAGFLAAWSFRWLFIGDVCSSLICAALIVYGIPGEQPRWSGLSRRRMPSVGIDRQTWWRYRIVVMFSICYFFLIAPLMGLEFTVPLLIKNEFSTSLFYIGVIYTINASIILMFSFLIERLIRNRNEYLMMILAAILWTAGMIVLLLGYSVVALMICTGVWTIGEIIASILVPSFVAKRVSQQYKGRFMALTDLVRSFAGVVCPVGLGLLWTHGSATAVVGVITVLPMMGLVAYTLLFLAQSRVAVAESPSAKAAAGMADVRL